MPPTPAIATAILLALGALSFYLIRKDHREYRAFKAAIDSRVRRRFFAIWVLRSALGFGATSLIVLALTGRLETLVTLPEEFRPARQALLGDVFRRLGADRVASFSYLVGFAAGLVAPLLGLCVFRIFKRRAGAPQRNKLLIGDIESLLPRSFGEGGWAVGLSLNAGVSEELFFRLLLPTLLYCVVGNAWIAFGLASLAFGAMHAYQGVAGVAATTILGALLSLLYLASGQLWIAIAVHAALDLRTLVLLPGLEALLQRPAAVSPSGKLG